MTKLDLISNFDLITEYEGLTTFRENQSKICFDAFFNSKKILTSIKYNQWCKNGITLVNYIETKFPDSVDEIKTLIQNSLGPLKNNS